MSKTIIREQYDRAYRHLRVLEYLDDDQHETVILFLHDMVSDIPEWILQAAIKSRRLHEPLYKRFVDRIYYDGTEAGLLARNGPAVVERAHKKNGRCIWVATTLLIPHGGLKERLP